MPCVRRPGTLSLADSARRHSDLLEFLPQYSMSIASEQHGRPVQYCSSTPPEETERFSFRARCLAAVLCIWHNDVPGQPCPNFAAVRSSIKGRRGDSGGGSALHLRE